MGELRDGIKRTCRDGKRLATGCGKKKGNKPEVILKGTLILLNGQFEFTTKHDSGLAYFEMIGNKR